MHQALFSCVPTDRKRLFKDRTSSAIPPMHKHRDTSASRSMLELLIAALWATCGSNLVKQGLLDHVRHDARGSVYVDDRILDSKREWLRWSSRTGLIENESKVVITAASPSKTTATEGCGLAEFESQTPCFSVPDLYCRQG